MSVLVRPIVTEKLTQMAERGALKNHRQYGFVATLDANKIQIKQAVEKLYQVNVVSLRTVTTAAKARRRNTKTTVVHGATSRIKKVYVTLAEGQEIDFYKNA